MLENNNDIARQKLLEKALQEKGIAASLDVIPKVQDGEVLYPSYAQQRLWFLDQLNQDNRAYNIPVVFAWDGAINLPAFKEAMVSVINRHKVLKSRFKQENDEVQIELVDDLNWDINLVDATSEQSESFVQEQLATLSSVKFDLATGPLFTVNLIKLSEQQSIVAMVFHHSVMDGWSAKLFIRDLTELYLAIVESREASLPELSIDYSDFAMWQRSQLTAEKSDEQLTYWKQQLAGANQENPIEYDKPFSLSDGQAAGLIISHLDEHTMHKLQGVADKHNGSLFMVILAAYKALLFKYSGSEDNLVGIPVWNRNHPDLDNLIGFFVNTLIIRNQVSGDSRFEQLLEDVKQQVLNAHEHQDVPYEQVIEHLGAERNGTDSPLLHSMFSLQHAEQQASLSLENDEKVSLPGLSQAKFDLSIEVVQCPTGLEVRLEYRQARYSEALMEQLLGHFITVLNKVAEQPDTLLQELSLLGPDEQAFINDHLTGPSTDTSANTTVLASFKKRVESMPDSPALSDEKGAYSYQQLDDATDAFAHYLVAQGVVKGDLVAIATARSNEFLLSMLACWKAGAAYLPLDSQSPVQRQQEILADAGVRHLIVDQSTQTLREQLTDIQCLNVSQAGQEEAATTLPGVELNDRAYVIYTSGSTGKAKGVEVSSQSLANLVSWYAELTSATRGEVFSQMAGQGFDATLLEFWPALATGAEVRIVPEAIRQDSAGIMQWLEQSGVTVCFMPTPIAEMCLNQPLPSELALRVLLTGGDALQSVPPANAPFELINMYGPTENTCVATATIIKPNHQGAIPIGSPIDNVTAGIFDRSGQAVPVGVTGELYLSGESLANGYLNNAQQTAERFVTLDTGSTERFYKTGDLVKLDHNGNLVFKGRNDSQVKIHGHRIELAEIRAAMHQVDGIERAYCVLQSAETGGSKYITAYYQSSTELDPERIAQQLETSLPAYMIPSVFVATKQWPLTENGKVDVQALVRDYGSLAPASDDRPLSETEGLLADIWKALLNVEQVQLNDNFFRLGGHSLLATQLVSKIKGILNVELALSTVFSSPTLKALAGNIDTETGLKESSPPPPIEINPREGENEFPQSFAQQRLWFLEQLEPNTTTYSVPCAYVIEGKVDVNAMQMAFDKLTRRHEVLRTSFSIVGDGEFVQKIKPERHCHFSYTNLSELSGGDIKASVDRIIRDEADTPFELTEGRVMRVTLVSMSQSRHFLLINMHHIVTDAWSMGIMFNELKALYRAELENQEAQLPDLAIQYADYSKWQTEWLRFGVLEELLFYWQEKLKDAPPELSLMTDYPKTSNLSANGDAIRFSIDKALTSSLNKVALENDATLFMVLMSAFNTLLYRYSGQTDIVVGVPVANRGSAELNNLIGLFVNTLVMRTDLSGNPSFKQLIARVRETALEAYEHQDLPYEKLVDQLGPERRWNRSPLFQVMFAYHNAPETDFNLDGMNILPYELETNTAKFDLNMSMFQYEGEIVGSLEFSTDLFKPETIQRMLAHFTQILQHIGHSAEDLISRSALLSNEGRQQLDAWSVGQKVPFAHGDVCQWFETQAGKTPDNLAISDDSRQLTYQQLDQESNRLARAMQQAGVDKGDIVALYMPRSVDMLVGFLATLKAGGAFLPMDVSYPLERNKAIIEDANVKLVLSSADSDVDLGADKDDLASLKYSHLETGFSSLDSTAIDREIDPEGLAYLIFTSGSTGHPKGIELPHKALSNLVSWLVDELGYTSQDVASQIAGPSFDASLCEWWPALMVGGSVHVVPESVKADPASGISWFNQHKITTAFIPTNVLELTFNEAWPDTIALRNVITGGDALRKLVPEDLPFKVYNVYGPAENACATTCSLVPTRGDGNQKPTIGKPIQNVSVYVLDENLGQVPVGVVGTLYVTGDSIANGYHNNPQLTEQRFIENPYKEGEVLYCTGDQVRFRADGELDFVGRIDDQVKIRGFRIELGEIYGLLDSIEQLKESYIHVRDDIGTTKKLVIYTVKKDPQDDSVSVDSIHQMLSENLPEYMLPRGIVFMDELPKNNSGKVDRSLLKKPDSNLTEKTYEYIEPRTDVEKALAGVWSTLLDYTPVSVNHNFFEQGGHSLLAMSLKSEIRRIYDVDVQMLKLFEGATIENIAAHVEDLKARGVTATDIVNDFWSFEAEEEETGLMARLKQAFSKVKGPQGKSKLSDKVLKQAVKSLVPLKNDGEEDPLFIVHPISGTVHRYSEVAAKMPPQIPVFGIQAISELLEEHHSINELAEIYVAAIRSVQPKGPYRLSGWSLGGVIALEIAQQLRAQGEEVSMLTLIDSFLYDSRDEEDERFNLVGFVHELTGHSVGQADVEWVDETDLELNLDQLIAKAKAHLIEQGMFNSENIDEEFAKRWHNYQLFDGAWKEYETSFYDDKLHLFMASEGHVASKRSPLQVWGGVAKNGVTIDIFSGDHFSMLSGDSARNIAEKLSQFINHAK